MEIYVMDDDGGNQRNLTKNPFKDWDPSWSPDSKRIAFVSNREEDGNREIFVINADGSNPRKLTNHPDDDIAPTWYILLLQLPSQAKKLRYGGGLNGPTDNCHY